MLVKVEKTPCKAPAHLPKRAETQWDRSLNLQIGTGWKSLWGNNACRRNRRGGRGVFTLRLRRKHLVIRITIARQNLPYISGFILSEGEIWAKRGGIPPHRLQNFPKWRPWAFELHRSSSPKGMSGVSMSVFNSHWVERALEYAVNIFVDQRRE